MASFLLGLGFFEEYGDMGSRVYPDIWQRFCKGQSCEWWEGILFTPSLSQHFPTLLLCVTVMNLVTAS